MENGVARPSGRGRALCRGFLPVLLLAMGAASGCSWIFDRSPDFGPQAYYQTAYPVHDMSEELARAFEAVKRITVSASYDVYIFAEEGAPTMAEFSTGQATVEPVDTLSISRNRGATAVVVSATERNVALMTAHHAVHFPDTVAEYYQPAEGEVIVDPDDRRVRSLSVKTSQSNWIVGLPDVGTFEILAQDRVNDLALIGAQVPEDDDDDVEIEELERMGLDGEPTRLAWGSFVYVLGHPASYPMVTRGIVSLPEGEGSDSFVVDGLWNQGMSGGPVLAIRGEDGRLEWVGMARAASAGGEHLFVPPEGAVEEQDPDEPYEGPIYLQEVQRIRYGIMLAVPMTEIRSFIDEHRTELLGRGFDLP